MRKLLLIDRPVDDEALAEAADKGAAEIVFCPDGEPPPSLAGLALGYHELDEPEPTAPPMLSTSVVAERLAAMGLTEEQIAAVTA